LETKKDLYNNILILSKEIELLIQLENFEKIEEILLKRDKLLEKISKNDFEIEEIKQIVEKIKTLDAKNFEQMDAFKKNLSKKMSKLLKNKKVIGSYKQEEIYEARLVDERSS
jgi:hypothetical protein